MLQASSAVFGQDPNLSLLVTGARGEVTKGRVTVSTPSSGANVTHGDLRNDNTVHVALETTNTVTKLASFLGFFTGVQLGPAEPGSAQAELTGGTRTSTGLKRMTTRRCRSSIGLAPPQTEKHNAN